MTSKPLAPNDASRRMVCHVRAMIEYQGRHYSVRIGQIESCRLLLIPVTPLSIPQKVTLVVTSSEFGRIEARVERASEREIEVEFHKQNSAIDHLLSLGGLQS